MILELVARLMVVGRHGENSASVRRRVMGVSKREKDFVIPLNHSTEVEIVSELILKRWSVSVA